MVQTEGDTTPNYINVAKLILGKDVDMKSQEFHNAITLLQMVYQMGKGSKTEPQTVPYRIETTTWPPNGEIPEVTCDKIPPATHYNRPTTTGEKVVHGARLGKVV